jgi:hypothetical protein
MPVSLIIHSMKFDYSPSKFLLIALRLAMAMGGDALHNPKMFAVLCCEKRTPTHMHTPA